MGAAAGAATAPTGVRSGLRGEPGQGRVDPGEGGVLAEDLEGLEERQADGAAGDRDADRGLRLAELEAVSLMRP